MTYLTKLHVVAGYPLAFTWHGGQYIDICWASGPKAGSAFEVINVWDAGSDEPSIPRTQDAFEARVKEWIDDPETDHAANLANFAW